MADHTTMSSQVSRLEVIQTGARRRWTLEEKLRIITESESTPRAVSATARRYGLSPSHLFWWRRLAREGRLGTEEGGVGFAPVVIADAATVQRPARGGGRIEIVLASGVRLIVDREVDAGALQRVVSVVERR